MKKIMDHTSHKQKNAITKIIYKYYKPGCPPVGMKFVGLNMFHINVFRLFHINVFRLLAATDNINRELRPQNAPVSIATILFHNNHNSFREVRLLNNPASTRVN